MIQCATLGIPKGMRNEISISIAFSIDILVRNENITSGKRKTEAVQKNLACELQAKIEHSFVRV